MTTAFVFSGGASLGAIQVGMAQALEAAGIRPDMVVGTSVGAVNAAWFAGGGSAEELADIWRGTERADLFPIRPLLGLRAFLGLSTHFVPDTGLRRLLKRNLRFKRIEDAPIKLLVTTTDIQSGKEVILDSGDAIDAVAASAALPGVYPPVNIGGRLLADGGIANNTPITTAVEAGATEVWVLSTGYSCTQAAAPKTALAMAMQATAHLVQQRLVREVPRQDYSVPVWMVPPPCPSTVSPVDFSHTEELRERARVGTEQWLANGRPMAMPLTAPNTTEDSESGSKRRLPQLSRLTIPTSFFEKAPA